MLYIMKKKWSHVSRRRENGHEISTQTLLLEKKEVCVVMIFNPLKNEFREKRLEREKRQAVVIIIFIPPSQNYESIPGQHKKVAHSFFF